MWFGQVAKAPPRPQQEARALMHRSRSIYHDIVILMDEDAYKSDIWMVYFMHTDI